MGRVAAVLRESNPFADFVRGFAPIAMQGMEERRKQEENAMLGKMYLESMRAPADAAVAPYQANAIQSQDDAFRKQMVAESSAMTDSLMANNPNFTQRIQGQTTPVTPEQAPALQQQFQTTNQANLSQANNQAQSAEQMLAMAKEKYGTAMFDRLAPIVASGKVPAQAMISIIERQVQTAEKTALKQAQNNAYKQAMELMKQGKVDEAKMLIAEYASPDAQGRLFASMGQGAGIHSMVKLGNGNWGTVDKTGKITDTGTPFNAPVGRGGGVRPISVDENGNPIVRPSTRQEKPTPDQAAMLAYERGIESGYDKDAELIAEYNAYNAAFSQDGDTPEKIKAGAIAKRWMLENQEKVNAAMRRMNKYNSLKNQTVQPADKPSLDDIFK